MHLSITICFLAMLVALSAADIASDRLEQGLKAQRAGDCLAASAAYRQVLEANPRTTRARHLLGICELQLGNMGEGIRQLEIVRREDPQNLQASYTLVSTYIAISSLDQAQRILDTTLRGDRSAAGRFMRGSYEMARGKYDSAIVELQAARKLGPNLPGLQSILGVTYCFVNRTDEAIPILESALKQNPKDSNAAAFLGWLYKDRDRPAEAMTLLQQSLQARPEDQGALFLLAQLNQARGRTTESVEMLERVISSDPKHRGAHVLLARLYQQLQRSDDAAREREIVAKLTAEFQAAQPGAQ